MERGRDAYGIKSLSRDTLEQLVLMSSEAFVILDMHQPGTPIVYASPACSELFGYMGDELVGRCWPLVENGGGQDPELERIGSAIARSEPYRATCSMPTKDGRRVIVDVAVDPICNENGERRYLCCSQRIGSGAESIDSRLSAADNAVLLQETARMRIRPSAIDRIDPATGFLRFGRFEETLQPHLATAQSTQRPITLLVFWIVELDVYRQTFGDKAAESCLRMIAAQIARTLRRASDLCTRYDDSTLAVAVLGQGSVEVNRLVGRVVESVRRLALHNPRGSEGRHIVVRPAIANCGVGAHQTPAEVIARTASELAAGDSLRCAVSS